MSNQALVYSGQNQLVVRSGEEITDLQRLGNLLAASGYFSDAREAAQASVKVLAGQELGIPPVAAMMGINIIKGKVALGGNLIASRIRAHGYEYRHKQFDSTGCVLTFWSKPGADGKRELLGESSFSETDAKIAGVYNDVYKKFPRNMYFNRAISNGAKWFTPDVFGGAPVYTPEELGAPVNSDGDYEAPEPNSAGKPQFDQAEYDRVRAAKIAEAEAYTKANPTTKPASAAPSPAPAAPAAPDMDPDERALRIKMSGKFEALNVFGELKEQCQLLLGVEAGNAAYYQVLQAHGVEKSDQFKTLGKSRDCAVDLHNRLKVVRTRARQQEKPPQPEMRPIDPDDRDTWVPTQEELGREISDADEGAA